MRDVTIGELLDAIQLETGVHHVLRVHFPKLRVRLPIDPAQAEHWDDRFILTTKYRGKTTTQVRTVKDDLVPGDAYVDLVFGQVLPGARYTLTVDPGGDAAPYVMFADRSHHEFFGT